MSHFLPLKDEEYLATCNLRAVEGDQHKIIFEVKVDKPKTPSKGASFAHYKRRYEKALNGVIYKHTQTLYSKTETAERIKYARNKIAECEKKLQYYERVKIGLYFKLIHY